MFTQLAVEPQCVSGDHGPIGLTFGPTSFAEKVRLLKTERNQESNGLLVLKPSLDENVIDRPVNVR